jgi:hypothetical protein
MKQDKTQTGYSEKEVKSAIEKAFQAMQKNGADRIVLSTVLNEKSKGAGGGWNEISYYSYYPKETLTKSEVELTEQRKAYQVIALVARGNPTMNQRQEDSLEVVDRVPVYLLTIGNPDGWAHPHNVFVGNKIDLFLKMNNEQKVISSQEILAAIEPQIIEYRQITKNLMEKAGISEALQRLETIKTVDDLLHEMRQAVANAKKG